MPASYLYVPADDDRLRDKAALRTSGAVILDLEDAVAPSRKAIALDGVLQLLAGPRAGAQIWIRANAGVAGLAEVRRVADAGADGVWLAKAESVALVSESAAILGGRRTRLGLLIESARGLTELARMLEPGKVDAVQLGEIDLAADLGHRAMPSPHLGWHRHELILQAAAAGVEAIGPVDPDPRAPDFRSSTELLRDIGFHGRACIHPAQAAIVDEVFTPSDEEAARARAVVETYDKARAAGVGVGTTENGVMVDAATVRAARRLLSR